jgi:hypothetical protein
MFGLFAFIFEAGFALILPLFTVRLFWVSRRKPDFRLIIGWIMLIGFGLVWAFLLGGLIVRKSANYMFLRTLDSKDVVSIKIGNINWESKSDIQRIIEILNQPVWHTTNHDIGGPFVDMTMTLRSGSTLDFRVGRYNDKGAVLIEQILINNSNSVVTSGNCLIPGLADVFENLHYSLPDPRTVYESGFVDYLAAYMLLAFWVVILWLNSKDWRRSRWLNHVSRYLAENERKRAG